MKTQLRSIALIAFALTLAFAPPGHARRFSTELEGTIQTVNLETKHATLLTKDGRLISFRWHEMTQFTPAAPLRKGAYVKVQYHELLVGESYVNRVDIAAITSGGRQPVSQKPAPIAERVGFAH